MDECTSHGTYMYIDDDCYHIVPVKIVSLTLFNIFIRLASLGGGPQAHVHMEGKKCRVLYLNLLGTNALFL